MRICINIRLVRPDGMDGIGWFSYEIVRRWVTSFPEHEFILMSDKSAVKNMITGTNVQHKTILPPARKLFLINWWNTAAKRYVNRVKPNIYVSLDGQYAQTIHTPILSVIHDLNFLHHPEWMTEKLAHFYNSSFPECAKKATRVATVSEYSKADISKSYGLALKNIDVVHNGYNEELLEIVRKPNQEVPFFLFVGLQVPRKNITGLIKSFTIFKEKYRTNHQLKLAGHNYLWNSEMKEALESCSVKEDIILLGRQPFEDLKTLYSQAEALLFIPHFEGFGIPLLEGFAAGIPVICSNTTSLPEVAGDAALMFSPTDYNSIADGMHQISTNNELRNDLLLKGNNRLKAFNWDNTADNLWKSLLKTVNSNDS